MQQCQACGAENPSGARFCEQCGVAMEARCTHCGASVRPGARFCVACGQPLETLAPTPSDAGSKPQSRVVQPVDLAAAAQAFQLPSHLAEKIRTEHPAREGERRQVTVLFGDIAGFTAMTEKLDPEDVHDIVRRGFELITTEIHRFEGTINQYGGDGLMALFGAPIAHEDAPRRAVHAALGIQRALRDYAVTLERERGLRLQMRIGINTGAVVVGRIGTDLHMEYTAIGDTINLASRLQSLARPGSVLISDATHKGVAGFFETLELGELEIKGHAPVRAFEVLRPHGRRARLDLAVERGLTPLIGRDRPLTTFGELFTDIKAGRGQVVFVSGEAGIGKSRLLLEFRRLLAAANEEVTWLEGRCVSFGASSPMLPTLDQLRENFRHRRERRRARDNRQGRAWHAPAWRSGRGNSLHPLSPGRRSGRSGSTGDGCGGAAHADLPRASRPGPARCRAAAAGAGLRRHALGRLQHPGVPRFLNGFGRWRTADADPDASAGVTRRSSASRVSIARLIYAI